jgi:microcystin-dependent protein
MSAIGEIIMWGGTLSNIPAGFFNCDGRLLATSEYPDLYEVIEDNFGASPPSGQFYIPDLQGRFVRGVNGEGPASRDPDAETRVDMADNKTTYSGVGSVQADAYTSHTHYYTVAAYVQKGNLNSNSDDGWGTESATTTAPTNDDNSSASTVSTETRPINAYLYFLICYEASS